MSELAKGGNAPIDSPSVAVSVTGAAQGSVDLMVFQLTDDRRVRSDADFVFFNQPTSPEGAVRLESADRISADLSAVPADISVLAVAVALDDSVSGSLAAIPGLAVTVQAGGIHTAAATGMTTERAAVLVELYRRGDGWKIRNVSAGWAAGLSGLATEMGVSVDDEPPAPPPAAAPTPVAAPPPPPTPAAAPPPPAPPTAAPPPPSGAPANLPPPPTGAPANLPPPAGAPAAAPPPPTGAPANLPPPSGAPAAAAPPPTGAPADLPPPGGKVDLGKRSGKINLTKGQRVAIDGSELIVAQITWPAATDYDVYALIRYRDGRTETVAAFGTKENRQFTLSSSDGAVRHLGDVGRVGQPRMSRKERKAQAAQGLPAAVPMALEKIEIRPHAGIHAIVPVAYSAQSNGTGSFRRYQVSMSIDNGRGTTVQIDAPNADDNDRIYSCVPGIILITDQGVVIDSLEQYSQPNSERRPVIAPDLQVIMDAGETNLFK